MPKERVHHGALFSVIAGSEQDGKPYTPGDYLDPTRELREEPSLEVSWNRDAGWVQIGYTAPVDWWQRRVSGPDWISYGGYESVYTGVLSRTEINHMIKTLRRARDAAYGVDE